jgi:hypothetical protein
MLIMRLFAVGVLLLFTVGNINKPQTGPAQTRTHERNANPQKQQAQQGPPNGGVFSIQECTGCFPVQEPNRRAESDTAYNPEQDSLYRWYLKATIAGAAVAVLGLIFLYVQSRATAKAAEAALQSATAVMNAERARLGVLIEPALHGKVIFGDGTIRANFRVKCTNIGKTVAWTYEIIVGIQSLESIPSKPPPLADNFEERPILRHLNRDESFTEDFSLMCHDRGRHTLIDGVVSFRDVYEMNGYCTFGYTIRADGGAFDRVENLAYNRNIYGDPLKKRKSVKRRMANFAKQVFRLGSPRN